MTETIMTIIFFIIVLLCVVGIITIFVILFFRAPKEIDEQSKVDLAYTLWFETEPRSITDPRVKSVTHIVQGMKTINELTAEQLVNENWVPLDDDCNIFILEGDLKEVTK